MGNECSDRDNKVRIDIISTRLNDYMQTIRSSIWKNGERNILVNLVSGGGYEGGDRSLENEIKFEGNVKPKLIDKFMADYSGFGGGIYSIHRDFANSLSTTPLSNRGHMVFEIYEIIR